MRPGASPTFVRDLDILYHVGTVTGLSDRELLGCFTARTDSVAQRAFEAIVSRHGAMVLGVCRRMLNDEQRAEDAFQATFLTLAMRAGAIRNPDSLGPWLHGVAAQISRRARVRVGRRREQPVVPESLASSSPESNEIDVAELRTVLDAEIHRLPAKYRRAIVLCYLEGKSQEDAARELGWTKGSISGRLARAKELLRARLTRRGFAPSAGLLGVILGEQDVSAAVAVSLVEGVGRSAMSVVLGREELLAASSQGIALARDALRAILLGKVKLAIAVLMVMAAVVTVLAQTGAGPNPPGQESRGANPNPRRAQVAARDAKPPSSKLAGPRLPDHARARLGSTQLRHEGTVNSVAFAPDSRTLASAGEDGVRFWDLATGEPATNLPTLKENGGALNATYSPDGTQLAVGRDNGLVQVWDLAAGKERFRLPKPPDRVAGLAFTPDGNRLATAGEGDSHVRIWDVATGRALLELAFGENPLARGPGPLAFSPDGTHLALGTSSRAGEGEMICIWDLAHGGGRIQIPKAHRHDLNSLAFTADGHVLITAGHDTRPIKGRNHVVDFVPQIRLWDVNTGQMRRDFGMGDLTGLCAITLSRDGKSLISAHRDRLLVWDLTSGTIIRTIAAEPNYFAVGLGSLAISPDGRTIAAARGGDHAVHLWDLATGKPLFSRGGAHESEVHSVAIAPDGHLVATGDGNGIIHLWDAMRGEHVHRIELGEQGWVWSLRFSPDGRTLGAAAEYSSPKSNGFRGLARLWEIPGGKPGREFRLEARAVQLAFSPDGRQVAIALYVDRGDGVARPAGASGEKHEIQVFDIAAGDRQVQLLGHRGRIRAIGFTPDGKGLVSASEDMTFRFWEIGTGKLSRQFPINGHLRSDPHGSGKPTRILAAVFSPDSSKAVTSGIEDDRLLVWDLSPERLRRHTIHVPKNLGATLAMAPDGLVFASASATRQNPEGDDTTIRLWEVATGRELLRLETGGQGVQSLAFSPDRRTLVSGLDSTTALIWDVSAAYDARNRLRESAAPTRTP